MSYAFSFNRRQWWSVVAGMLALLALMFGAGFVGGALWQRSRAQVPTVDHTRPPAPVPASPQTAPPLAAPDTQSR